MIILSDEILLITNYKRKISKVDELKILDNTKKEHTCSSKYKQLVVL
jgi:hypothetical protein